MYITALVQNPRSNVGHSSIFLALLGWSRVFFLSSLGQWVQEPIKLEILEAKASSQHLVSASTLAGWHYTRCARKHTVSEPQSL
jgi:hypothetical protein